MNQIHKALERISEFQVHPLGFFYLKDQNEFGISQRVHVWHPSAPDSRENSIHQHSYEIVSTVLYGSIKNEIFVFSENESGNDIEYKISYENENSISKPTGRTGILSSVASFETIPFSSYTLTSGTLHRTATNNEICVTSVITTEKNAPILSYGNKNEEYFARRRCTTGESEAISDILHKTIHQISIKGTVLPIL